MPEVRISVVLNTLNEETPFPFEPQADGNCPARRCGYRQGARVELPTRCPREAETPLREYKKIDPA